MIDYQNECVDCGKPCRGHRCKYYSVPHLICDRCGDEVDRLWDVDGEDICLSCLQTIFDSKGVDDI